MSDIHHRIKRLRLEKKLSMEALADKVGVTWQTIQQWEKNTAPKRLRLQTHPSINTDPAICGIFFVFRCKFLLHC
jgi:DNA-binding XRE family transcriptional regulator